jgi:hypothetical protein
MENRMQYTVVGKRTNGRQITGYYIMDPRSSKSALYSKEVLAYLVGKGMLSNCTAQIYKGKILFRGVGESLDNLPTINENGVREDNGQSTSNGSTVKNVTKKGYRIVALVVNEKKVVGYYVIPDSGMEQQLGQNGTSRVAPLSKAKAVVLAKNGMITNATVVEINGKRTLRGVGCELLKLRRIDFNSIREESRNRFC